MYPTCSGNIDKCKNDCLLNRVLEIKVVRLVFGRFFFLERLSKLLIFCNDRSTLLKRNILLLGVEKKF